MNRTRIITASLALALVATGLAISAARGDAGERADVAADEKPTTSSTAPSPNSAIDDGEHVGRMVAAYVAPDELVFEAVELLVGEDAQAAGGDEASDFFVRDLPGGPVTVPVDAAVEVTAVDCAAACIEGAPSDYATLTRTAADVSLHRITIIDGAVVEVDAIYLP